MNNTIETKAENLSLDMIDYYIKCLEENRLDVCKMEKLTEGLGHDIYKLDNNIYVKYNDGRGLQELDYQYGMGDSYNFHVWKSGLDVFVDSDLNLSDDEWEMYTLEGDEDIYTIVKRVHIAFSLAGYDYPYEEDEEEDLYFHPEDVITYYNDFCKYPETREEFGIK